MVFGWRFAVRFPMFLNSMSSAKKIRQFFRWLRARRFLYQQIVEIRIYKKALLHNVHAFQNSFSQLAIAPVLKSNAYGHGLRVVAQALDKEAIPFICVDSFFEALILRNEHITKPILILGYTPLENIAHCKLHNIYFSILSLEELKKISQNLTKPTKFHLKINTGMNRHGLGVTEAEEAWQIFNEHTNLVLDGVYTHLADADTIGSVSAKKQIDSWNKIAQKVRSILPNVKHLHCAATAGTFYSNEIDANVMRLGLGLYGINAGLTTITLEPALELVTKITTLRQINVGESVGYNATFSAQNSMKIATIPLGYTEGVDRRLSNRGAVEIRGKLCPIIGRVSMNIVSVDVSDLATVELEDQVIVISNKRGAPHSVEAIAKTCSTIPYEILVHISPQLRRKLV